MFRRFRPPTETDEDQEDAETELRDLALEYFKQKEQEQQAETGGYNKSEEIKMPQKGGAGIVEGRVLHGKELEGMEAGVVQESSAFWSWMGRWSKKGQYHHRDVYDEEEVLLTPGTAEAQNVATHMPNIPQAVQLAPSPPTPAVPVDHDRSLGTGSPPILMTEQASGITQMTSDLGAPGTAPAGGSISAPVMVKRRRKWAVPSLLSSGKGKGRGR